jgi:hypothetical protein
MATDAENLASLQTIKAQTLALLVEITAQPKPNYTIRNQTVSWQSYKDSLLSDLKEYDRLINSYSGVVDIESFGY